jgi:hypothetical protein
MSNERTIDRNFARIVVYHNDPRDLEDVANNRRFVVDIYYRGGATDIDQGIERLPIDGAIDEVIGLLRTLDVNGVEVRARVDGRGRMIIDCVPFDHEEAVEHFRRNPNPLRCYLEPITRHEFEERLELWKRNTGRLPV